MLAGKVIGLRRPSGHHAPSQPASKPTPGMYREFVHDKKDEHKEEIPPPKVAKHESSKGTLASFIRRQ